MHSTLSPLRACALITYIILTQFEQPAWCLEIIWQKNNGTPAQKAEFKDWDETYCNDPENTYTNSNWPKLDPIYTHIIEITCLMTMLAFQWMRNQYRELDDSSARSWKAQKICTAISLFDIVVLVMIIHSRGYRYPWIAAFIRPFYMVVTIRLLREYWNRYLLVMLDSMPMVLFILVYILYFSWMLQRWFSGTLEGVQYFSTFGDSFFNMLVLMTTSNYPDVMLPAYQISRWNCLFFITYLVLGLFLMMNLLLAIFYSNFKSRFEENLGSLEDDRSKYLMEQFKKFGGDKGHLT